MEEKIVWIDRIEYLVTDEGVKWLGFRESPRRKHGRMVKGNGSECILFRKYNE